MKELIIFNLIIMSVIAGALVLCKLFIKGKRGRSIMLLIAALLTIACHYSSLLYHQLTDGQAATYLKHNPNLILPIYPCNVVMWACVIFALCKDKAGKFGSFLADYIFWFGTISTLVGMFANVDFIRNPTLSDYDVTKGIVAHATMLFNVLLIPIFGHVKISFFKNLAHIVISVVMMLAIGMYCNLIFRTLVSDELAYEVNSMFLLHSPFEGVDFLTYPTIAGIAVVFYAIVFFICELFAYENGNRFYNRISRAKNKKDA